MKQQHPPSGRDVQAEREHHLRDAGDQQVRAEEDRRDDDGEGRPRPGQRRRGRRPEFRTAEWTSTDVAAGSGEQGFPCAKFDIYAIWIVRLFPLLYSNCVVRQPAVRFLVTADSFAIANYDRSRARGAHDRSDPLQPADLTIGPDSQRVLPQRLRVICGSFPCRRGRSLLLFRYRRFALGPRGRK